MKKFIVLLVFLLNSCAVKNVESMGFNSKIYDREHLVYPFTQISPETESFDVLFQRFFHER